MKLKTKRISINVARRIVASLMAGSLVFCTGSFAFAAENIKPSNPSSGNDVTVNENSQTINGESRGHDGNFSEVDGGSVDENNNGSASNNKMTVNGSKNRFNYKDGSASNITVTTFLNGGVNRGYGDANYNFVVINGGTFNRWVEGGWATYGNAIGNTLIINSGIFNNAIIDGGYTFRGNANRNTVNIEGGYFDLTGGINSYEEIPGIYGGYVAGSGDAIGNVINIRGGKSKDDLIIKGDIVGGYTESGEVRNNEINIYGGDLYSTNIYAARVGDSYTSQPGWGNSINFYTKGITAKQIGGFDNIGFYLPSNTRNGDTILTLTGGSATDWNQSRIKVSTSNAYLNPGDTISLVKNSSGLNLNINDVRTASAQLNGRNIASHGTAWDNYVDYNLNSSSGELTATIRERTTPGLKEQIGALPASVTSVRGLIDSGTNRILNWLPPEEIETKGIDHSTAFEAFMGASVESVTIDTGNGSKLRNKSGGQNVGVARALKNRHGIFLFAPITDYGTASYDTTLDNGLRGGGNSKYFTAGLIARQWNTNGMYYEASLRAGQMRTTFTSDKFTVGDEETHASYSSHTPVYTGHVRIGWRGKVSPQNVLDVYGVYSHNHIGSIDANLQASAMEGSQEYRIGSSNSRSIRIGARLTRQVNEHNRFYSGLLYQYQFSDDVMASYMDVSTPKFGAKGSSGMIELGWQMKPSKNSAVMLDSALVGWVGKQKGLSFQIKLKKDF